MSGKQTGGEPLDNQAIEPNVAVVDGADTAEPITPVVNKDEVVLSDEVVLEKLQPIVEEQLPKESRKKRAIKRSVESFNKVMDDDGYINFSELASEVEKNPKGLATFAEANNYDLDELKLELDKEYGKQETAIEQRMGALEDQYKARENKKVVDSYKETIISLVAKNNMTLNDFYNNAGEDFNLFVSAFTSQGKSPVEAAELAFAKVIPNVDVNSEKTELLNTVKKMPAGKNIQTTTKIVLATREQVNEMGDEQRLAYKAKFRNADKTVNYL